MSSSNKIPLFGRSLVEQSTSETEVPLFGRSLEPDKMTSIASAFPKSFFTELREQLFKMPILGEELQAQAGKNFLVASPEKFQQQMETVFPTQEGFTEDALKRAGRIAPYLGLGGAGIISTGIRSAAGGALGEIAKSLGAPEWAQSLAEMPATLGPDLAKKIMTTKSTKDLVEFARKEGLTEKQIAPLIQSHKKIGFLKSLVSKRGNIKKVLSESRDVTGNIYEQLAKRPEAQRIFTEKESKPILNAIEEQILKLPKESQRKILGDFEDLKASGMSGNSLTNFWNDLNTLIGKGDREFGIIKQPLLKGMESVSPEFGKDFQLANQLRQGYYRISSALSPSVYSDVIDAGILASEAGQLWWGLWHGNLPMISIAIGEKGATSLAKQLLINPRFQGLAQKTMKALNEGKIDLVNKFVKEYQKELKKDFPEASQKLEDLEINKINDSH